MANDQKLIARTREVLRRLYRRLVSITARSCAFVILTYAIFLAIILRIGPDLQYYIFSAINSSPGTNINSDGVLFIPHITTLAEWLTPSINIVVIWVALCTTIATFSAKTLRGAAVLAGAAVFLSWSIADVILLYFGFIVSLAESVSANLIGGLAITVIIFPIICLYDYLGRESLRTRGTIFIFPAVLLAVGLTISTSAFLIVRLVYKPIPARFEAALSAPLSGSFSAESTNGSLRRRPFDILPPQISAGKSEIMVARGRPIVAWRQQLGGAGYDLRAALFQGCSDSEISALTIPRHHFAVQNVERADFQFSDALSEISVMTPERAMYSVEAGNSALFWIDPSDAQNGNQVSYFISERGQLGVEGVSRVVFFMRVLLAVDGPPVARGATLAIRIGNHRFNIRLRPRRTSRSNGPLNCEQVGGNPINRLPSEVATDASSLGILVSIDRAASGVVTDRTVSGQLTVRQLRGWVSISGIEYGESGDHDLGQTSLLTLLGNVTRLRLDGVSVDVSPDDRVAMLGNIRGNMRRSGERSVRGVADVWIGDDIANRTSWQTLDSDTRIFLASSFAALLAALATLLRPTYARLKKDEALFLFG